MLTPATNLKEFYIACDPETALAGGRTHPYYLDLSPGRHTRSATVHIRRMLEMEAAAPDGAKRPCKVLLTGHVGTGKSTELNSLAADLTTDGYFVVRISALDELNIYDLGWQAGAPTLYQSALTPAGAVYTPLGPGR